jgi:hypothetical protein
VTTKTGGSVADHPIEGQADDDIEPDGQDGPVELRPLIEIPPEIDRPDAPRILSEDEEGELRKLVEDHGIDAFAWYVSFHLSSAANAVGDLYPRLGPASCCLVRFRRSERSLVEAARVGIPRAPSIRLTDTTCPRVPGS